MGTDDGSILFTGILAALGGLVVVGAALKGRAGTLKRGHWLGMRTVASMSSDEAWNAMHRAGAPYAVVGGCGLVVAGIVSVVVGTPQGSGYALLAGCAWLIAWVFVGVRVGNRAAAAVQTAPPPGRRPPR